MDSAEQLAHHAPKLQSLWCELTLTSNEPLILPPKLQSLQLQLYCWDTDAINSVLTTLTALSSLSRLHLKCAALKHHNSVQVSILAACRALSDLTIESYPGTIPGCPTLSDAQADQIRSSLGHLQRISAGWMETNGLVCFLKPPVSARWQDIGDVLGDARTGKLLLRLPSITKLDLRYERAIKHVDFLPQLPRLTALSLDCEERGNGQRAWYLPADALLASVMRCTGLTHLSLTCGLNSAQWSTLFAKLTKLKKLTICRGDVRTLQCFAAGPIMQPLEELAIELLAVPPSELPHLYHLRRLHTLRLNNCFCPRLDDATIDQLFPPTALLPALTELFHSSRNANDEWNSQKRQGPSFEWMQSRLRQ